MRVALLREKAPEPALKNKFKPHQLVHIPAIRSKKVSFKIPKTKYDFLLISSQNVARFHNKFPKFDCCICIGKKTYESLPSQLKGNATVLTESNKSGVLSFFRKKRAAKIFYPRSAVADFEVIRRLRAYGHQVQAPIAYQTKALDIRRSFEREFKSRALDALIVSSPSIVKSLDSGLGFRRLQHLDLLWLAIGPTTAKALKNHGILAKWPRIAKIEALAGFLKS